MHAKVQFPLSGNVSEDVYRENNFERMWELYIKSWATRCFNRAAVAAIPLKSSDVIIG